MQQGMIQLISRSIDLGTPYTLTSPDAIIYLPDGTQVSGVATVSPSIAVSANPHTFSYLYVPTMGGQYYGMFEFLYGSQTLQQNFNFWVPWTDIYTVVRGLLGIPSVTETRIDDEFNFLYTLLRGFTNNALPEYYLFNTTYQNIFDLGMTRLIASRLRGNTAGSVGVGELVLFKKGTTTAQWKSSSSVRAVSIEDQWWDDGMQILSQLSEILYAMTLEEDITGIMTRGPLALGNTHPTGAWRVYERGEGIPTNEM